MEALVYVANCLYLSSYLVRDMLRLRLLTLAATVCLLFYFLLRPEPLVTVVGWNLFFIVINAIQIAWLVGRRRPVLTRPGAARNVATCSWRLDTLDAFRSPGRPNKKGAGRSIEPR